MFDEMPDDSALRGATAAAKGSEEVGEMRNEVGEGVEGNQPYQVQLENTNIEDDFSPDDIEVIQSITAPVAIDSDIYSDFCNVFSTLSIEYHISFLFDAPS
jgi:hypothetical protein